MPYRNKFKCTFFIKEECFKNYIIKCLMVNNGSVKPYIPGPSCHHKRHPNSKFDT